MDARDFRSRQAAPRGSKPMYFPAAPFALADAVTCAALVDIAYDQYVQWHAQGYPSKSKFQWKPSGKGYAYSAPLSWSYISDFENYDEPIGFVASDTNLNAFLVFRGSVSDEDDYQDALFDQTAYQFAPGYGQVHYGFYQIYQQLSPQIYAAIAGLNRLTPFKRFFFTGHSLGCGLSSLAVPDVITNTSVKPGGNIAVLHHNFASPRVGDPQYAWAMNNNGVPTWRIVNTEDLVPDAPTPIITSYLYKHIGTSVDFTAQYNSIDNNHSLDIAYQYALAHPGNPEGSLPPLLPLGLSRRPGVRLVVEGGRLIRPGRPLPEAPTAPN
jgi:triacylglycerol lipase